MYKYLIVDESGMALWLCAVNVKPLMTAGCWGIYTCVVDNGCNLLVPTVANDDTHG